MQNADSTDSGQDIRRRTVLTGGTLLFGTLAGCLGNGSDNDTEDGGGGELSAAFTWNPAEPSAGEPITFDATKSTGDIVEFRWSLPDSEVIQTGETTLTETVADPGQPTVTLEVADSDGETSSTSHVVPVEGTVFHELDSVTAGLPEYGRWFDETGEQESHLGLDLVREQEIQAYTLADMDGSGPPFPDIGTIAEAFPANNATLPMLVLPSLRSFYPFLNSVSVPGVPFDGEPLIELRWASAIQPAGLLILIGNVDEERLRSSPDVDELGEHAGFTVYNSNPDHAQRPFAVDGDTVVLPFGNQEEKGEDMVRLERVLESRTGGSDHSKELTWLLEHCGDGAFVVASLRGEEVTDTPDDGGFADELGIDAERFATFREFVETETAGVMVVDAHEGGRVTRTGFAFERAIDVPDGDAFADVIAPGAVRTNVATAGNRIVVEAFWD